MSQIKDFNELSRILEKESVIPTEATDMLKEMDILPSTATQAALNGWLVTLGKRLKKGEKMSIEILNDNTTLEDYENWLSQEFTSYSYGLYTHTMKGDK